MLALIFQGTILALTCTDLFPGEKGVGSTYVLYNRNSAHESCQNIWNSTSPALLLSSFSLQEYAFRTPSPGPVRHPIASFSGEPRTQATIATGLAACFLARERLQTLRARPVRAAYHDNLTGSRGSATGRPPDKGSQNGCGGLEAD